MRLIGALLVMLLAGCGNTPCETDLDCLVVCQCANGRIATADYACNSVSTCGTSYDADLDCERPCGGPGTKIPLDLTGDGSDDDDDDAVDDDDSAAR